MTTRVITLSAGFLLLLNGCGVPNTLTLDETKEAASASDTEMRGAASNTSNGALANELFGGFGSQTIKRACPGGGDVEANVSIGANVSGLMSESGSFNMDYSMVMNACSANDITMDGNMKLTMSSRFSTSSSGTTAEVEFATSGGLYYDGPRIKGSCSFDYDCTASASTTMTGGTTTAATGYASCSGNYCGHDINKVFEGSLIPVAANN